ncbi:hypothetical protein BDP27DRAFT_1398195 [Rhodocollybia butyracea]|uniref:Uncharacterized protein n=1 Tax=Rhodocollybia butyracea TaxID=206335 RepID=A0A9P5Q7D0_9AGAR|nr:hypothetical protein BDP27DRAFT_1398195 [Rhodocollybia butyracea]
MSALKELRSANGSQAVVVRFEVPAHNLDSFGICVGPWQLFNIANSSLDGFQRLQDISDCADGLVIRVLRVDVSDRANASFGRKTSSSDFSGVFPRQFQTSKKNTRRVESSILNSARCTTLGNIFFCCDSQLPLVDLISQFIPEFLRCSRGLRIAKDFINSDRSSGNISGKANPDTGLVFDDDPRVLNTISQCGG